MLILRTTWFWEWGPRQVEPVPWPCGVLRQHNVTITNKHEASSLMLCGHLPKQSANFIRLSSWKLIPELKQIKVSFLLPLIASGGSDNGAHGLVHGRLTLQL